MLPASSTTKQQPAIQRYEQLFVTVFADQVTQVIGDFSILYVVLVAIVSILRIASWLAVFFCGAAWAGLILALTKYSTSRGWRERLFSLAYTFTALTIAAGATFWVFHVYAPPANTVCCSPNRWIQSIVTAAACLALWRDAQVESSSSSSLALLWTAVSLADVLAISLGSSAAGLVLGVLGRLLFGCKGDFRPSTFLVNAAVVLLHRCVSLFVQFHVLHMHALLSYCTERAGGVLASGLSSTKHPFITERAALELSSMDARTRRRIYEEDGASRAVCQAAASQLRVLEADLRGQEALLAQLEQDIRMALASPPHRQPAVEAAAPEIFRTPQKEPPASLPPFVRPRNVDEQLSAGSAAAPSAKWTLRHTVLHHAMQWVSSRSWVALYTHYLRSLHCAFSPPLLSARLLLVQGIAAFIVCSYDEDTHGQTQFCIADVLEAMADCVLAIDRLHTVPKTAVVPAEGERGRGQEDRVRGALVRAVEAIEGRFAGCRDSLDYGSALREKLGSVASGK